MSTQQFDLDTPLINFVDDEGSTPWTIRHAMTNIFIAGGVGSGKTSGSLRAIFHKQLSAGFGGLILTVKNSERKMYENYMRATNRLDDLIVVEAGKNNKHFFDFLGYLACCDSEVSYTQNVVSILKVIIESGQEKSGKSDDPFWDKAATMLIHNVLELCLLAYDTLSVRQIYNIAVSAPKKGQKREPDEKKTAFMLAFEAAQKKVGQQIDVFEKTLSPEQKESLQDDEVMERAILDAIPDAARLKSVDQFFVLSYRELADRTRSILDFSFNGFLFALLQEPIYSIFCRRPSTFSPEDTLQGKVILLDLPVTTYGDAGRDVQTLFKLIFQQAMKRRDVTKDGGRPVFLISDEAQVFLHPGDADWLAVSREYRVSAVYATQNLPNLFANMGGDMHRSENKVKALLSVFGTKIFHANSSVETNEYASALIGDGYTVDTQRGISGGGKFGWNRNRSFKLERMVRPEQFAGGLKTGGPDNDFIVQAYIHLQGKPFHTGMNHRKIAFSQI